MFLNRLFTTEIWISRSSWKVHTTLIFSLEFMELDCPIWCSYLIGLCCLNCKFQCKGITVCFSLSGFSVWGYRSLRICTLNLIPSVHTNLATFYLEIRLSWFFNSAFNWLFLYLCVCVYRFTKVLFFGVKYTSMDNLLEVL